MLRKLFRRVAESMHAPPAPCLPSSPPEDVTEAPRDDVDVVIEADTWATLLADLLVEILLCLGNPAAVWSCAGVCKPWRHAIMDKAPVLGFHPLLGVFHNSRHAACLRRTPPGPFQFVLPWKDDDSGGDDDETAAAALSFIPAVSHSGGVYRGLYRELLCSRDGFILLMARTGRQRHCRNRSLCLCNPVTGDCTFLRPADTGRRSSYVLLTGSGGIGEDLWTSGNGHDLVARVLAVQTRTRYNDLEFVFNFKWPEPLTYQVFSPSLSGSGDGEWGPVKRSVGQVDAGLCVWMRGRSTVVCRDDVVHWLAGAAPDITCTLALDVRTGRTWTTAALPEQCRFCVRCPAEVVLATSDDGRRPALVQSLWGPKINVWVLTGGNAGGWTLQRTIENGSSRQTITGGVIRPRWISLSAFCPRSRCVVGASWESDQEFVIDLGSGGFGPCVRCIGDYKGLDCWPYEIDSSSTNISLGM